MSAKNKTITNVVFIMKRENRSIFANILLTIKIYEIVILSKNMKNSYLITFKTMEQQSIDFKNNVNNRDDLDISTQKMLNRLIGVDSYKCKTPNLF